MKQKLDKANSGLPIAVADVAAALGGGAFASHSEAATESAFASQSEAATGRKAAMILSTTAAPFAN